MIEIVFHGTGGQGVVVAAKLLADAVAKSGYRSQSFAAYGGERRGGKVESFLRVSEDEMTVHSKIYEPDYIIIVNENLAKDPAIAAGLKKGGLVLINSAQPPENFAALGDVRIQTINANQIAAENGVLLPSGLPVVNTTVAGVVAALVPLIGMEQLAEAIREGGIPSPEKNIKAALDAYRRFIAQTSGAVAEAKVEQAAKTVTERYPLYRDRLPPCEVNCPAGEPIQETVSLIQEGRFAEALANIRMENPFPGICGRVCYHPCETECNRNEYDQGVATNALERAAYDYAGIDEFRIPVAMEKSGRKVAVIGAGPAGMAAAYFLARFGHDVTVFEALPYAGGIPRIGIPEYRLPKDIVDKEMGQVIGLGIAVRTNTQVGKDILFADIVQGYDATFVATGAHQSMKLGIPGESSRRVILGLDFLKNTALGKKTSLGRKVVVIGGGNVAIDAARTAKRLGAKEVNIVYRRTRAEMPAYPAEVEEAEREEIAISFQVVPVAIQATGKEQAKLECARVTGGKRDEGALPQKVEGSNFVIAADKIIVAIGDRADTSFLNGMVEMQGSLIRVDYLGRTSRAGVFAGGDATMTRGSVVEAIGSGKRAALGIDLYLRGGDERQIVSGIRCGENGVISMEKYLAQDYVPVNDKVVTFAEINTSCFDKSPRAEMPQLTVATRESNFAEVNLGLAQEAAIAEAERCFHCGRCNLCENCYIFCPDLAIAFDDKVRSFAINRVLCKGCGICITECPRSAILWEDKA